MKEVIYINEVKEKEEKPVEFTHFQDSFKGWQATSSKPEDYDKVIYLGKCRIDGDMFACYSFGNINIHKGHLNSGKY